MRTIMQHGVDFRDDNPRSKGFACPKCLCVWTSDEYELDTSVYYDRNWRVPNPPVYDICPDCNSEVYANGTFGVGNRSRYLRTR